MVTDRMLKTGEVAALFRVSPGQVLRWVKLYPKQLGVVQLGRNGQYRYRESKVTAALLGGFKDEEASPHEA